MNPREQRRWARATMIAPLMLLGWASCDHGARGPLEAASVAEARPRTPPAREVIFRGACDASGAVPLSAQHFVVADDEDNVLRVYDADGGGAPLSQTDVSSALGLPLKGKKAPKAPELDLEAATRIGDHAYWVASHGRNKKGKLAPARLRTFATTTLDTGAEIELVGHAYENLVQDLIAAPQLAAFQLAEAATRAPKAEGGLNIEGLTAAPDGQVWLAFRNPVPRGHALLVPFLNLEELVARPDAGPARFGTPVLLDLGGRGVRSLSWWRGRYLLIAGHHAGARVSSLFTWDGKRNAREQTAVDLRGYNPEGFFTPEERDDVLILSDDGDRLIDGTPCKKLKDPSRKQFRGVWRTLP